MDKLDELIMSHDELHTICKSLFQIILNNDLEIEMENVLKEAKIQPGFAQRAEEVEQKFSRERRMLMSTGVIQ